MRPSGHRAVSAPMPYPAVAGTGTKEVLRLVEALLDDYAVEETAKRHVLADLNQHLAEGELSSSNLAGRLQDELTGTAARAAEAERRLDARKDELMAHRVQLGDMRRALERTERNLRLAVNGQPVRDLAENLAENVAAIRDVRW